MIQFTQEPKTKQQKQNKKHQQQYSENWSEIQLSTRGFVSPVARKGRALSTDIIYPSQH